MKRCREVWRKIRTFHRNESGALSLETVLILGAVAVPLLVFVLRFGWPRVRLMFEDRLDGVHDEADRIREGVG
ncbi:hypothetical protein Mal4_52740 [Maioricimonas rarisocia]|uniref:TadE-like protein n=1 Tax=Maioricimonas rarisocia TaxID=2528026 RepID=A0A517ZEL6_9PLAN|nr:hypothetical protein [Maioricimonas rarisocia]QDU40911.1 hypothetical protein Mal4_52740 [Maioricimonas rarisocia]